jgi:hypothetical protein
MMMKGPFRELIPVDAEVVIKLPTHRKVTSIKLLLREQNVMPTIEKGFVSISIPRIEDHEIIGIDLGE